jgi:hypothetical protein
LDGLHNVRYCLDNTCLPWPVLLELVS